eukprot:gnl/TRDRNA2_/TRDRNA2_175996_c0_seq2.p1 gnl/TRDRNA2_/TRDRNA2_175996_c0~~gnl/TRDRNA2_/TRDRNA2_175996_c0_seq2.p1  ORF type:complete len:268 (-),score=-3.42 gnl/TRDRNA2_/TRDRNA2_175996_c0_seq2:224-1027(-)
MIIDFQYCKEYIAFIFDVLQRRYQIKSEVRQNLIVAICDLVVKWPVILEPKVVYIYNSLMDSDVLVRRNTLIVLSYLILNDKVKVKKEICYLAKCIIDKDDRIQDLTRFFFNGLAQKDKRQPNSICNLIPIILLHLSFDANVETRSFRNIMSRLLHWVRKDKQTDIMVMKLLIKFSENMSLIQQQKIVYCITLLCPSEIGIKMMIEYVKTHRNCLTDGILVGYFRTIFKKIHKRKKYDSSQFSNTFEKMLMSFNKKKQKKNTKNKVL